jgi:hypothetical protein
LAVMASSRQHADNVPTFPRSNHCAWNFASAATLHIGHVPVPDEVGHFLQNWGIFFT